MARYPAIEAEVKRLYEDNELTLIEMGTRYGVAPTTISRRARRSGWVMRSEMLGHGPRLKLPTTARLRALLAHRLYEFLCAKFKRMEADVAGGKMSEDDFARSAKPMSGMLATLDRLGSKGADADEEERTSPDTAAGEIERLQREIMERFERVKRRRDAEAGSE